MLTSQKWNVLEIRRANDIQNPTNDNKNIFC